MSSSVSDSEESISGLASNKGESAHQSPLSEAQNADQEELWTSGDHKRYRQLFLAAQRGDWKNAKSFIERDPNALNARITAGGLTVLQVAAYCCRWGFVLKLLELLSPESIAVQDKNENTVLHYVAAGGSLKTAKALVRKNTHLLQMANDLGQLPLFYSIYSENNELMWYLTLITRVDSPSLPKIIRALTESGSLDIALYFIQRYPNLALDKDVSLLYWLSTKPSYFFSGSDLGFVERWIYKFVHVEIENLPMHLLTVNMEESTECCPVLQQRSLATQVHQKFKRLLWKAVAQPIPFIKVVRDKKLKHECAVELVNHVCTQLSSLSFQQIESFPPYSKDFMGNAVANGIEEIVWTLLQHFPEMICSSMVPDRNIFQIAIEYRQEKIVNILKEISPMATKNFRSSTSNTESESLRNTLHLAGKLAPAFKLFSVSGAALQMQRELQWFKEVENIIFPYQREWKNTNNETAKDVFRKEHNKLAEQGEKWMKDTANSCMLVSTLIATVLFAAAFTVPGGNVNDKGIPIFLQTDAFTVFAISDALGLFSSLTSLLMFLAILTAQYAIEDFLESLPKKLIIGLGSLFIAIAAIIIAFGAALTIVFRERWHWVSVPITLVASFPMAIFVMLQLPLFIQMVQSTYGASLFRPWHQEFE